MRHKRGSTGSYCHRLGINYPEKKKSGNRGCYRIQFFCLQQLAAQISDLFLQLSVSLSATPERASLLELALYLCLLQLRLQLIHLPPQEKAAWITLLWIMYMHLSRISNGARCDRRKSLCAHGVTFITHYKERNLLSHISVLSLFLP